MSVVKKLIALLLVITFFASTAGVALANDNQRTIISITWADGETDCFLIVAFVFIWFDVEFQDYYECDCIPIPVYEFIDFVLHHHLHIWFYRPDRIGNEIKTTKNGDMGSTNTNPFRMAGMYWDFEVGRYFTPNRSYDPTIGRWTQEDPFFHALHGNLQSCTMQSGNLYVYCMNNPVFWVDPSGLYAETPWHYWMLSHFDWVTNSGDNWANHIKSLSTFITAEQLTQFGWTPASNSSLEQDVLYLNAVMTFFGINQNIDSMMMFLSTVMEETGGGQWTLERNPALGTFRGAGYGQISHRSMHSAFLRYVEIDYTTIANTSEFIANDYFLSMFSAGWAWAVAISPLYVPSLGRNGTFHEYISHFGGSDGVFLVVSSFYSLPSHDINNNLLRFARLNPSRFSYANGRISANGMTQRAPQGWARRMVHLNNARDIWG